MASGATKMPPQSNTSLLQIYFYGILEFSRLHEDLRNAYHVDHTEGYSLRKILMCHTGLSTFEFDLLLFFNERYVTGYDAQSEVIIHKLLDALPEVTALSDRFSRMMEELQQNMPMEHDVLFKEFVASIGTISNNISRLRDKLALTKLYRAMWLTSTVRDMQHCLPEHVLEIIFLLIHTTFHFRRGGPRNFPNAPEFEGPVTALNDEALTKAKEFLFMINNAYSKWERQNLDPILFYFRELPQVFIDVLLGFRALMGYAQKMILNEYCRTTALLISLSNFQESRKSIPRYEGMSQSVDVLKNLLKDCFRCIQGPELVPFMNSNCVGNHRLRFSTEIQAKCKAAHERLYDYRESVPCRSLFFDALKRCSFEKNFNVKLLNPFHELGNCYNLARRAVQQYISDECCFDINLKYEKTFFEEKDCLVPLPLICSRAIKLFFTSPEDESVIFPVIPEQNEDPDPQKKYCSCKTEFQASCPPMGEYSGNVPELKIESKGNSDRSAKSDLFENNEHTENVIDDEVLENGSVSTKEEKSFLVNKRPDLSDTDKNSRPSEPRDENSTPESEICSDELTSLEVDEILRSAQENSSSDINNLCHTASTEDNNQSIDSLNFPPADLPVDAFFLPVGFEHVEVDPSIAQPDACEEKYESSSSDDEFVLVPQIDESHSPEMSPGKDASITENEDNSSDGENEYVDI